MFFFGFIADLMSNKQFTLLMNKKNKIEKNALHIHTPADWKEQSNQFE